MLQGVNDIVLVKDKRNPGERSEMNVKLYHQTDKRAGWLQGRGDFRLLRLEVERTEA